MCVPAWFMGVRERGGGAVMSAVLVSERARGVTRDRERRAERREIGEL